MVESPEPLFELRGVSLPGRLSVDQLRIEQGWTAVMGPSGAGKSTLLEVLVGYASPGRGGCVTPRVAAVAWAPASGSLWPHLSVREHLGAVVPASGLDVDELLRAFELDGHADKRPDRLSDGEADRLRVARALATDAAVLVLDEPFRHVEGPLAAEGWRVLRERCSGRSVVFASHDPRTVLEYADRVVVLEGGCAAWAGPLEQLHRQPATAAHGALLGDGNWFAPGEAQAWLGVEVEGWVRAEQIELAHPDSAAQEAPDLDLVAYRAIGPVARSMIRGGDGRERGFYHRAAVRPPVAGGRVRLRWLGPLLAVLATVAACGGGDGVPSLETAHVHRHGVPPLAGRQPAPRAVAPGPAGSWLVLDDGGRVLVFDAAGAVVRSWMMPEIEIGKPEGVLVLADGRIAVADTHYSRVVLFDDDGREVDRWGEPGDGPGQFRFPVRLCQGDDGTVYVAEYGGNDRVQRFSPAGEWLGSFGGFGRGEAEFQRPSGLAFWDGSVFVADALNGRVHRFAADGTYRGVWVGPEQGLDLPYDIAVGGDGAFYLVEYGGGCLTAVRDGRVVGRFGRPGTGPEEMRTPWGLGVIGNGRIVVADTGNRRLVEIAIRP